MPVIDFWVQALTAVLTEIVLAVPPKFDAPMFASDWPPLLFTHVINKHRSCC